MLLASNFDEAKLLMACGWDHSDWSRKKQALLISRKDSLRVREPVAALWCNDETPKVIDSDLFLSKWGHDLLDAEIIRLFEERIIKHWVLGLAIPARITWDWNFPVNETKPRLGIGNPSIISSVSLKWHRSTRFEGTTLPRSTECFTSTMSQLWAVKL